MGKIQGKNRSTKYGQKLIDTTKKSVTDALKIASKMELQDTAEVRGDLAGNKIAEKIIKTATKNTYKDPEKLTAQVPRPTSVPDEIYIIPENDKLNFDELRLL